MPSNANDPVLCPLDSWSSAALDAREGEKAIPGQRSPAMSAWMPPSMREARGPSVAEKLELLERPPMDLARDANRRAALMDEVVSSLKVLELRELWDAAPFGRACGAQRPRKDGLSLRASTRNSRTRRSIARCVSLVVEDSERCYDAAAHVPREVGLQMAELGWPEKRDDPDAFFIMGYTHASACVTLALVQGAAPECGWKRGGSLMECCGSLINIEINVCEEAVIVARCPRILPELSMWAFLLLATPSYGMRADPFAKFAQGFMRGNQPAFNRIAADIAGRGLPAGATVLDIGASAGEPSLTIARKAGGLRVVSTDYAPPNKALGEMRAEAFGLSERVEFHTTNANDLSAWGDGTFDAAVGTYVLMFADPATACREVHRVLKPGAPFVTTVWQPAPMVDIFGAGLMKMVVTMREAGSLPMPDPDGPPPTNPCNLANSAPEGPLGDALRAAGFDDVAAEEWAYPVVCAGADLQDVAARFIEATPFYNDILDAGGEPLMKEAISVMVAIFEDAGHEMVDLAAHVPEWSGVDNPDGITRGLLFKTNTCLYVTARA